MKRDVTILIALVVITGILLMLRKTQEVKLSSQLTASKTTYALGESIVVYPAVTNLSDSSVVLILPQPGSVEGIRYPYCSLEIRDESGTRLELPSLPSVLPPPLLPAHFFTLTAKQSLPMFPHGYTLPPIFTQPGVYTLRLRYDTTCNKERLWHGPYTAAEWNNRYRQEFWTSRKEEIEKVGRMLSTVPQVSLLSDYLRIEII